MISWARSPKPEALNPQCSVEGFGDSPTKGTLKGSLKGSFKGSLKGPFKGSYMGSLRVCMAYASGTLGHGSYD